MKKFFNFILTLYSLIDPFITIPLFIDTVKIKTSGGIEGMALAVTLPLLFVFLALGIVTGIINIIIASKSKKTGWKCYNIISLICYLAMAIALAILLF